MILVSLLRIMKHEINGETSKKIKNEWIYVGTKSTSDKQRILKVL